jgi:hypothetical protein
MVLRDVLDQEIYDIVGLIRRELYDSFRESKIESRHQLA